MNKYYCLQYLPVFASALLVFRVAFVVQKRFPNSEEVLFQGRNYLRQCVMRSRYRQCLLQYFGPNLAMAFLPRGVARIFQGGSHCVKMRVLTRLSLWPRYRHGIFATCCRLIGYKRLAKGRVTGTPGPPPGYALVPTCA